MGSRDAVSPQFYVCLLTVPLVCVFSSSTLTSQLSKFKICVKILLFETDGYRQECITLYKLGSLT